MEHDLTQELLHELFDYDDKKGKLTWAISRSNKIKIGDECGTIDTHGYRKMGIGKKTFYVHKIIWMYVNGKYDVEIDHINHNRSDNRIINLRAVTRTMNTQNSKLRKTNKSGVHGVIWVSKKQRWVSRITVDKKALHLGSFINKHDAINARKKAEEEYGFHKNHGKDIA